MVRRRPVLVTTACVLASLTATPAAAHQYDHPVPSFAQPAPLSSTFNAGGDGADWELLTTIATGNPHTDLDFFTSGGETYAAVGTLAVGPNGGGVTIIQLTSDGEVDPQLVGAHPSASCLSNPAAALGLQHDVVPYLSIMDVGVNCSEREGLSNAIMEYMAAGVACVVTDRGGNPDLIAHGVTGLTFTLDDDRALASHIFALLGDEPLRQRLIAGARAKIARELTVSVMLNRYETFYRQLAAAG